MKNNFQCGKTCLMYSSSIQKISISMSQIHPLWLIGMMHKCVENGHPSALVVS